MNALEKFLGLRIQALKKNWQKNTLDLLEFLLKLKVKPLTCIPFWHKEKSYWMKSNIFLSNCPRVCTLDPRVWTPDPRVWPLDPRVFYFKCSVPVVCHNPRALFSVKRLHRPSTWLEIDRKNKSIQITELSTYFQISRYEHIKRECGWNFEPHDHTSRGSRNLWKINDFANHGWSESSRMMKDDRLSNNKRVTSLIIRAPESDPRERMRERGEGERAQW